jgi:CBS domain containing-hemolysin-like protein
MDYASLLVAAVLVLANGFFVATEFSLVKIRPSRLKALVEEGRPGAANVLRMVQHIESYLSATQFGITLSSLGLGWLGEPAFARRIEPLVERVVPAGPVAVNLSHSISFALAFALITFLHIVVGELVPKNVAIAKTEATTLAVALPMRMLYGLFFPAVFALTWSAKKMLNLFGIRRSEEQQEAHSEEELRVILASSAAAGAITNARAEVLERALEMMEKPVRRVMVPRGQVRYLDLDDPLEKNVADARAAGHTWLLVCRAGLDEVQGVVNVKDMFFRLARNELQSLQQIQRPVLFMPENANLEQLLSEFRRRKREMAVVVDEHGGTSGLVTLSDVVAELLGDVAQLGASGEQVRALPGGRFELPGSAPLDELEERLDVKFRVEDGEISTIAGFLMAKLGRVPERGDKVTVEDFEVSVEATDGPRVVQVRIQPRGAPAPASADGKGAPPSSPPPRPA